MKPLVAALLLVSCAGAPHAPREASTERALLPWLVGRWRGNNQGEDGEEGWASSLGGVMVGTATVNGPQGTPVFYELATMTSEGGRVVLRIRHFSGGLEAREDKGSPIVAHSVRTADGEAAFAFDADPRMRSITYRRTDGAAGPQLTITLEHLTGEHDDYRLTRVSP